MSRLEPTDTYGMLAAAFAHQVPPGAARFECLRLAWERARWESRVTYEAWRDQGGVEAYVVYRAAQDRADAAQDALAQSVAVTPEQSAPAAPGP